MVLSGVAAVAFLPGNVNRGGGPKTAIFVTFLHITNYYNYKIGGGPNFERRYPPGHEIEGEKGSNPIATPGRM